MCTEDGQTITSLSDGELVKRGQNGDLALRTVTEELTRRHNESLRIYVSRCALPGTEAERLVVLAIRCFVSKWRQEFDTGTWADVRDYLVESLLTAFVMRGGKAANSARAYEAALPSMLFERYDEQIRRYARKFGLDDDEAENVLGNVLLDFLDRVRVGFELRRGLASVGVYVHSRCYWRCLDERGKRPHIRPKSLGDEESAMHADDRDDPARQTEREDQRAAVRACVDRLPERYKTVLVLYDYCDWTQDEIGEVLSVATSTVCTRRQQARKQMSKCLQRLH